MNRIAFNLLKTKKFVVVTALFLIGLWPENAIGQFFEGVVTYDVQYKSRIPGLSDVTLTKVMGSVQSFHIKGSRYLTLSNGEMVVMQLYEPKENKLYFQTTESDTLLWMDGSKNGSPIQKMEREKEGGKIAGYDCEKLIFTTKTGKETYWFSPKLKADAQGMSKHAYNNWAAFLKESGALPLKMVISLTDYEITLVARTVEKKSLEDNFFALPPKVLTAPAPF